MRAAEELYDWLDTLGFADLASCSFVRAATGGYYSQGASPPRKTFAPGFLLADDGRQFQVFHVESVQTRTYSRTPPGAEPLRAVYHEPGDLRAETEQWLAEMQPNFAARGDWVRYNPQHVGWQLRDAVLRVGVRTVTAFRTWQLWRSSRARGLYEEHQRHHGGKSLRQHVCDEIAHLLMWQAVEAFADPAVSRPALLARFERIVEKFPVPAGSEPDGDERFGWLVGGHTRHARAAIDLLGRMIAEDQEHARRPARPFEELTRTEQIEELIFQLREQNGRQMSDPGSCDIFADEGREESPAHRLVQLGLDVVPRLIDALDDDRFTRCVGHHRSFYFSHHVLRIGDCLGILEQIAARSFWQPSHTNAAMLKDGAAEQTRQKVLAWWHQRQQGEEQQLVRAVALGDRDSISQAVRLIERYPNAALAALDQGVRRADAHGRARLIFLADRLTGSAVVDWLREQLRAPLLSSRVTAARVLWRQGHEDVLPLMIDEWRRLPSQPQQDPGAGDLMIFLALCSRPESIRALADDLRRFSVDLRLHVIEVFAGSFLWVSWGEVLCQRPAESADVASAIDELLAGCLDDTQQRIGLGGTWAGKSIRDPRLCDLAAHVLSRRWQQPERFDLEAPLTTRDRQRDELQELWRTRKR